MDERIEVGYRNIGSIAGKDYHHKFLLYTDKDGNQLTISGWTGKPTEGLPYGKMNVETNLPYDATNPDHARNPNAAGQSQYRELITSGPDLSSTWAQMVSNAQAKDDKYPYDPLSQNSNTLADSVLRDARLPDPKRDGILGHWSPASGNSLSTAVEPSEPGLGNSSNAFSAADNSDTEREARLRDNPHYQQALAAIARAPDGNHVFDTQQDRERIAAALAVEAGQRKPPLPEIHEVVFNPANDRVFAVWKNPGNDLDNDRIHVDRDDATKQPANQNLEKLEGAEPRPVHVQEQEMKEVQSRGAMSLG